MSKRPSFQFYPSDWRTEAGLRLCSMAARGLWIEMLCLMHDGEPYGHLTLSGRPLSTDAVARLIGEPAASVKKWTKELAENEVFSTTEEGVIFSRRMVRDEALRDARAEGGKAGSEHGHKGAEHGRKGGRPRKSETPSAENSTGDKKPPLNPPPSSSSSTPSPASQGSEAKASAPDAPKFDLGDEAVPPADAGNVTSITAAADAHMWNVGKAFLTSRGVSKSQAGSLIGKWKGAHGVAATVEAIGIAEREPGLVDPTPFIEKVLRNRHQRNGRGSELEMPIA